ncbi:hypothetical protein A1O1_04640 [Capronia coronata CBS 617.96]|uniref:Uncharacterized protein n=1 Tax=Capronia coronata CBS 617.96 TaxID=1182541 RepID=W9YDF7_9EURO|nr:uncharacterized protein A1O1_04640 [Capronia coronata CBS 617.96]EXJ87715.1 hypothetical protein A1O1_04640 [Capronia coronata CBS 617.96]
MLRKQQLRPAVRLTRLRATLRQRPLLAGIVKTIHVPDPNIPLYLCDGSPNPEYDAYLCTVASVVMVCLNLEALTGFVPFYNHTFDRLTHALSTRPKLRQHVWVIGENEDVQARCEKQFPPGLLDHDQRYQFALHHEQWNLLETLLICSPGSLGVIEHDLFVDVLHSLPALKNLCVSSFDPDDFHDETLLSLPPLTSLRLEECYGVTDAGLTKWASSPCAVKIDKLCLLHQNITSLLTLSKVMASLDRLTKFSILQTDVPPSLPVEAGPVVIQPILASKSLRSLHWDILCPGVEACLASDNHGTSHWSIRSHRQDLLSDGSVPDVQHTSNTQLALSIMHGGFPSLCRLRAPRDTSPPGVLQSVCRPVVTDDFVLLDKSMDAFRTKKYLDPSSQRVARLRAHTLVSEMMEDRESVCGRSAADDSAGDSSNETVTCTQRPSSSPTSSDSSTESLCQCETSTIGSNESLCKCVVDASSSSDPARSAPVPSRSAQGPGPVPIRQLNDVSATDPADADRWPRCHHTISTLSFPMTSTPMSEWNRPIFDLSPDVPGYDENGGLVGWGDLLRISEKARAATGMDAESDKPANEQQGQDMCTGQWNRQFDLDNGSRELVGTNFNHMLSLSSTSLASMQSAPGRKAKSKWKSTSRLSLPLGRKEPLPVKVKFGVQDRSRHVATPRGDRGGCIAVEDFF